MSMITENVAQIRSRIAAAARAAGRDPADIRLCAATKMNDSAAVREAIAAGVDCCGENRVQELVKKLDEHAYDGAPVHFIGALQRNKVRQVVGQVDVIESVSCLRISMPRPPSAASCRISCWRSTPAARSRSPASC